MCRGRRRARLGAELVARLHLRERFDRGVRIAARQSPDTVHDNRLHARRLSVECHRGDPFRVAVDRPPRARQRAAGGVEKALEVAREPRVAAVHRKPDPVPGERRGEALRCEPLREHRVTGLGLRFPRQPQLLRLRECAGLVPGPEQGPGMTAAQLGGGVRGIPLDELAPLAPIREPAQPALSEADAHRFAVVAFQERLELGPCDVREPHRAAGRARCRGAEGSLRGARAASPVHRGLFGGDRSASTKAARSAGFSIAGHAAPAASRGRMSAPSIMSTSAWCVIGSSRYPPRPGSRRRALPGRARTRSRVRRARRGAPSPGRARGGRRRRARATAT